MGSLFDLMEGRPESSPVAASSSRVIERNKYGQPIIPCDMPRRDAGKLAGEMQPPLLETGHRQTHLEEFAPEPHPESVRNKDKDKDKPKQAGRVRVVFQACGK